jgi:hypothetical protein
MKHISVAAFAEKYGVSERTARNYCAAGKIEGATIVGKTWNIPADAELPGRKPRQRKAMPLLVVLRQEKGARLKGGIYHRTQIDLTYNSNHIEGSRLTHDQTRYIFETNTIGVEGETIRVDDIIETINHFAAVRYIVDNISAPLTQTFLKKLHHILTYGTYADRKENLHPGEYRTSTSKIGVKPKEISSKLATIIKDYESSAVNLEKILDFHVRLEKIRPFVDYNGRLGRLVMMKECLRYGIDPFVIDDKRRGAYIRGIEEWETNQSQLILVTLEAQKRFQGKMELCNLFQYARYPSVE